jgi:hypothetical protein
MAEVFHASGTGSSGEHDVAHAVQPERQLAEAHPDLIGELSRNEVFTEIRPKAVVKHERGRGRPPRSASEEVSVSSRSTSASRAPCAGRDAR